jgi:hypothetical protein
MGAPARLLPPLLFLGALACGGAKPFAPATTTLDYAGPTDTSQWRLVKDTSSTASHLVLDLLAPAGASGMGVALVLDVDGNLASWSPVAGGGLVGTDGFQGKILASQENPTPPIAYGGGPVLTVALDLGRGAPPGPVPLTVSQAGHLAAPMSMPTTLTIAVGVLTAR